MTCREVNADLALYAGGDLDDAERVRAVRRHVANCLDCRERLRSLKSSLQTLAGSDPVSTWVPTISLWPRVEAALRAPAPVTGRFSSLHSLRHWTPFAAMAAACVLLLLALRTDEPTTGDAAQRSVIGPPSAAIDEEAAKPPPPEQHSPSARYSSPGEL
jgi:hypothetical protein